MLGDQTQTTDTRSSLSRYEVVTGLQHSRSHNTNTGTYFPIVRWYVFLTPGIFLVSIPAVLALPQFLHVVGWDLVINLSIFSFAI